MDSYLLPEQEYCIDHTGKQLMFYMQPDHWPTAKERIFRSCNLMFLFHFIEIPSSVCIHQMALNLNVSWLQVMFWKDRDKVVSKHITRMCVEATFHFLLCMHA